MLVNPMRTKTLVICRSRTIAPISPNLMFDCTVVERVAELRAIGVVLETKMSFEDYIRLVYYSASSELGIRRKALSLFGDPVLVLRCFCSFLLPVFKVLLSCLDVCWSFSSLSS